MIDRLKPHGHSTSRKPRHSRSKKPALTLEWEPGGMTVPTQDVSVIGRELDDLILRPVQLRPTIPLPGHTSRSHMAILVAEKKQRQRCRRSGHIERLKAFAHRMKHFSGLKNGTPAIRRSEQGRFSAPDRADCSVLLRHTRETYPAISLSIAKHLSALLFMYQRKNIS
jgi:hypothetical protein